MFAAGVELQLPKIRVLGVGLGRKKTWHSVSDRPPASAMELNGLVSSALGPVVMRTRFSDARRSKGS